MKRPILIVLATFTVLFTSCEFYIEEPVVVVDYDDRDTFVGVYDTEEYSQTFDSYAYYDMRIEKSYEFRRSVYIKNFYGVGIEVIADVNGDRLVIPLQEVGGFELRGSGRIFGNELSLSYTVIDLLDRRAPRDYVDVQAWR